MENRRRSGGEGDEPSEWSSGPRKRPEMVRYQPPGSRPPGDPSSSTSRKAASEDKPASSHRPKPQNPSKSSDSTAHNSCQASHSKPPGRSSDQTRQKQPRASNNQSDHRPDRASGQASQNDQPNQRPSQARKPNKPDSSRPQNESKKPSNDQQRNEKNPERRLYRPEESSQPAGARGSTAPVTIKPASSTGGGGGLLKLNPNALSQLKASSGDRIASSSTSSPLTTELNDLDNRRSTDSFAQQRQNPSARRGANRSKASDSVEPAVPGGQLKMLFDPNNPNKPIYVKESKSNPRNQYTMPKAPTAEVARLSISPKTDHFHHEQQQQQQQQVVSKPVREAISAEAHEVHMIAQNMQQYEQKLKYLIDSFDIRQPIEPFVDETNRLRQRIEQMCIQCLFTHIETASNLNVELSHWRSCYHQLIETLRKEYCHTNPLQSKHHHNISVPKEQMAALGKRVLAYIDEGIGYYDHLIERIETEFIKFNIGEFIDFNFSNQTRVYDYSARQRWTNKQSKETKFALMCLNRSFISLGDLARYKELIFPAATATATAEPDSGAAQRDYSQARLLYLKALQIAPRSSRAYHQLAILAMYTRRRLDAVYYYFRCLEVSTPLTSVRQALNSLFDEARQKSDLIMKCLKQALINRQKRRLNQEMSHLSDQKSRVEIWYKPPIVQAGKDEPTVTQKAATKRSNTSKTPASVLENDEEDDSSPEDQESDQEEEDDELLESLDNEDDLAELRTATVKEKNLSVSDLNKRFMLNYLNSIGKLFSKVGLDHYPDVCSRMLHEFKELLGREPCPFGKMRLLQLTLINISTIDIALKSSSYYLDDEQPVHRSQVLECAIQLGFDMFALVAKRFTVLLRKQHAKEGEDDTWQVLLPSIKLFVDWILCNSKVCFPLPDQLPPDLGPVLNRWSVVASMLNLAHKLVNTTRLFEPGDQLEHEVYRRVKLDEDVETAGFVPLLSLSRDDHYDECVTSVDAELGRMFKTDRASFEHKVERACTLKRLEKLCLFAEYLCGMEQPVLRYDVLNSCYSPVAVVAPLGNPLLSRLVRAEERTLSECSSSSQVSNSAKYETHEEQAEEEQEQEELLKLKEKRRQLQSKMEEQQRRRDESLVELGKQQRRLELEIRPKFVVPDTNCFIDHLQLISAILATSYFIVVVPLLVINELDKLAKSVLHYNYDSVEHAEYVQRNAKTAVKYLTEKFENRERNLKALTSQGSVLETIQFRSEEIRGHGTNDELILGCCLHYCRDNARDFMPKNTNDAIHLYREVVLLTEDRHLRLKAHTRNVPVKDIVNFCKWCNLLNSLASKTQATKKK